MSDHHDRERINASFVFEGKSLQVTELGDGWRASYDGKDVEHANLDHALAGALGRPPGSVLALVREILEGQVGSDRRADTHP